MRDRELFSANPGAGKWSWKAGIVRWELVVDFLRVILFTELTLLISNFKYRVNKKRDGIFFVFSFFFYLLRDMVALQWEF